MLGAGRDVAAGMLAAGVGNLCSLFRSPRGTTVGSCPVGSAFSSGELVEVEPVCVGTVVVDCGRAL